MLFKASTVVCSVHARNRDAYVKLTRVQWFRNVQDLVSALHRKPPPKKNVVWTLLEREDRDRGEIVVRLPLLCKFRIPLITQLYRDSPGTSSSTSTVSTLLQARGGFVIGGRSKGPGVPIGQM